MARRRPAIAESLLDRGAGVFRPTLVQIIEAAVRQRGPDESRKRIGDLAEPDIHDDPSSRHCRKDGRRSTARKLYLGIGSSPRSIRRDRRHHRPMARDSGRGLTLRRRATSPGTFMAVAQTPYDLSPTCTTHKEF